MIPRWKFVLYSLLLLTALLFTFFLLIFVVSLILFVLSQYGFMYVPSFGVSALLHGLLAIPLMLFVLAIVLVALVEILVRCYAFSLRTPILTTLGVIIFFSTIVSFFVALTPAHNELRLFAKTHHLDFIVHQYDRPRGEINGVTVIRGIVIATSSHAIVLSLFDGATTTVYASTFDEPIKLPSIGEDVVLLGKVSDSHFEAKRILPAPSFPFGDRREFSHHQMK